MMIFIPRFASHDYKMADAAQGTASTHNYVQKQEGVQFCVFDQEWAIFSQKLSCKISFESGIVS